MSSWGRNNNTKKVNDIKNLYRKYKYKIVKKDGTIIEKFVNKRSAVEMLDFYEELYGELFIENL